MSAERDDSTVCAFRGASAVADTIAAVATPVGAAVRAVLRISGPAALEIAARAFRPAAGGGFPTGERCVLAGRFDDGVGEVPARALVMPGPRSFTGEDVVELHLPGHPELVARALERLVVLGARPAEPGEFTRRAFLAGKLDLSRAEGILALSQARGEQERRAATALFMGGLAERVASLREALDELRALAEASLDFDEASTGHVPEQELERRARRLAAELERALAWEERRIAAGQVPRVVLTGLANAGKSSLHNALLGQERSLVSEHPGTTRDATHGRLLLAGAPVTLVDVAGEDDLAAGPDREAQALAAAERAAADLLVVVVDASRPGAAHRAREAAAAGGPARLVAWNQIDRPTAAAPPPLPRKTPLVATSARTGAGLDALREAIAAALGLTPGDAGEPADPQPGGGEAAGASALSRELAARHREALRRAGGELAAARGALAAGAPLDLVAEHFARASRALDAIEGRTLPEDLLERIFSRFCIGK